MKLTIYQLILILTFSSFSAWSEQTIAQQTLCVPEAPPYSGSTLNHNGPLTQAVIEVFALSGIDIVEQNAPWARIMQQAKQGKCIILGLWETEERREQFHFSTQPVVKQQLGLYSLKGNKVANSKGKILAIERSSYVPEKLLSQGWITYWVTTPQQGLKMLASARVDALYSETGHADYLINQQPKLLSKVIKIEPEIEAKFGYLAIAKDAPIAAKALASFDSKINQVYQQLNKQKYHWIP